MSIKLGMPSLEIIAEPVFLLDDNLCYVAVNGAYLTLVSSSADALINQPFVKSSSNVKNASVVRALEASLSTQEKRIVRDFCSQTSRWLEYHISRIPTGLSVLVLDITLSKEQEDGVCADEKRWRKVEGAAFENINERKDAEVSLQFALEAAQMGEWTFDAISNTTRRSVKFNEIFGYKKPLDTWSFDDFSKHVHPDDRDRFKTSFTRALSDGEDFKIDARIIWPDQSVHWICLRGRVYLNRQGHAVRMAGLIMDTTAETVSALEIQSARLAAEDANREKSYFLANMSHEIRTPIGAILGFTDVLSEPGLDEESRRRYLGILRRNGENLAKLINDILDLSKVEAGFLEIENTQVNLHELLDEVASLFKISADAKNLELSFTLDPEVPSVIITDGIRLRQILTNIFSNAIKFTMAGRVRIQIFIENNSKNDSKYLKFRVMDTGGGISAEAKKKLFNPFMQADNSTTRKFGGTGLGLALSRRLARSMGGDLILEQSQVGHGSSFLIAIPLVIPPAIEFASYGQDYHSDVIASNKQALENGKNYCGLKGIKVLLAEDSLDNQELILHILDKQGICTDVANDGVQAVEKALQDNYDIVIMDMQMPRLDGYSATRELRRAGFNGPILALTANAMRTDRDKCLAAGCDEYITKPIEAKSLFKLMGNLIEHPKHH